MGIQVQLPATDTAYSRPTTPDRLWSLASLSQWLAVAQSQRVKRPKRQADHKPECGVKDSTARMQRAAQYTNSGSSRHMVR